MGRKFYDISLKGGEYTDRDGNKKNRFQPAGTLVVEDDGRMWGTFKQLGLEIQFSVFEQKDRSGSSRSSGRGAAGMDDDMPF